jgi:scyllo-inositol 2-dehydrogenase (NADP+)
MRAKRNGSQMNDAVIRVGLAGYGLAGSVFHAPLIRACKRMELCAVLTSRDAPHRVSALDELIERSDLVVVASPNTTHFPIAKQALEAGRHVVVDKPFTVTISEADALIELAARHKLVLSVFHNRRWDSDYLTVRDMWPQLGEVLLFEANWDRFRPAIKQGWREVPQDGAGLFNDLGPHLIDQALQLFGRPDAVEADVLAQREAAGVDDYFDVTLHYGPARVCLRSSSVVAAPRPRFAVHGTQGSLVKLGLDPQEAQLKAGLDPRDPAFGIDAQPGTFTHPDGSTETVPPKRGNYLAFYEGIAAAILDGAPVPVAAEDAREGIALIDLARNAARLGRRLPNSAASSRAS